MGGFLLRLIQSNVMLINMNLIKSTTLLLVVTLLPLIVSAELYKGLNAEGNVVYSDTSFKDAEIFIPAFLTITNAPKVKRKNIKEITKEETAAAFKYTDFDIISPIDNQTIWNQPELTVSLQLKPGLNIDEGHTVWLMMNGKTMVKNSQNMSIQIGRAERGAHQLQAHVKDTDGKTVASSRAIIVHIKQTTVK